MLRYHSTGVTTLVTLMAAHRLAAQARAVAAAATPPIRSAAAMSAHATEATATRQRCRRTEPCAEAYEWAESMSDASP